MLCPKPGETGLDATLGFGGHASELLRRVQPRGRLFGIHADPIEIVRTEERLRKMGYAESQLIICRLNYAGISKLLPQCGKGFDFVLAELGVSSMQLDNPARGFTYKTEGPQDLRLNPERGKPVWTILESLTREEFEKILRKNSDEPHSAEIAKAVYQSAEPVKTITALAGAIRKTLSGRNSGRPESEVKRSMRRTFQALRIEVNDEFFALGQFLISLSFVLRPRGRVVVLSFHSGGDRCLAKAFEDGLSQGFY